MPGRLYISHSVDEMTDAVGAAWPSEMELPRIEISPGEQVVCMVGQGALKEMRWSMIMSGRRNARGRPVMETIVNARSETVFDKSAYEDVRRAVLPVSGWYEWTGKARKKTRWRLRPVDGGILYIAAIWDVWSGPGGIELAQCAAVTCEPNADVEAYHHRMPLILQRDAVDDWLNVDDAVARGVVEVPQAGTILVEEARDVQDLIGH